MIFRALDPELDVSIGGGKASTPRYSDDTALTAYPGPEHQRIKTRVWHENEREENKNYDH